MQVQTFRDEFSFDPLISHFNNAGQAPIPISNRKLAEHWLEKLYREGAHCSQDGWAQTEVTRQKLATFIGAKASEIAFFQTTASAISQAAFSIPLKHGDEILTWDQEYPSNFYPWVVAAKRSGAKLVTVPSVDWQTPIESLMSHVTTKTRVVAVSWVQYQTGAVTDLKALSAALCGKDIWLVADGIQGIGVRPFNFHESGFDIVCSGSHKWLCSSYGGAFMAVREARVRELEPLEIGAMTYGNPDTPKGASNEMKPSALRYEPGSKPMIDVIAMSATLDLFQKTGTDAIFEEASRLAELLRTGLRTTGMKLFCTSGPIINFAPANGETAALAQKLSAAKISHAMRGPGIRISLHAFNRENEVERMLSEIGD